MLQGYSTFYLKTNTTVYLSLQVWDDNPGRRTNVHIRNIVDLVIPFNETTANNVWKFQRFTLSDGAYLEIQFQIARCYDNFGGLGCNFCIDNYYTSSCEKYCVPVQGSYTCNGSGDKVCAEHKTGENCDMCQEKWNGEQCEKCAENYFPENVCNVRCTAVEARYTCSDLGKKLCDENWKGAECDTCAEHRTGGTCEECSEGWRGNKCQACAKDHYPEGVCNVTCTAVEARYTCSDLGKKVCYENWKGAECDTCAEHRTGGTCEECSEGWRGNKCQACAKDYYPEGVCNVTCTAVEARYTCSDLGKKVCYENWKGAECDTCAEHRTGGTCEECSEGWRGNKCQACAKDYYPKGVCNVRCTEEKNKFKCTEDGRKACYKNWRGEECDNCSEKYFGEFCEAFCEETGHYNCSLTGEMVCLDKTTTVESNCKKFSKTKIIIGAVTGTTFFAVILLVGTVLMRKKNKTSRALQSARKTDAKHAKPEKTTGVSKIGQSSTDLNASSKEMTYATLNHNSSDQKYTENEVSFQNIGFLEVDMTYATLNQGLEKKVEQMASHGLYPPSEDDEDAYSHLTKYKSSIKNCCKEQLEEEETYADITILGPKGEEEPYEAAEDNTEECMYTDVSFVGKRNEFRMHEDRINEKEGGAIYFTMRETRDEHAE